MHPTARPFSTSCRTMSTRVPSPPTWARCSPDRCARSPQPLVQVVDVLLLATLAVPGTVLLLLNETIGLGERAVQHAGECLQASDLDSETHGRPDEPRPLEREPGRDFPPHGQPRGGRDV